MRATYFLLGISLIFSVHANAKNSISPLAEARTKLTVPNYTSEERQTLVDQAYLFMSKLFVHRNVKIKDFGNAVDPIPKLEALKKKPLNYLMKNFTKG